MNALSWYVNVVWWLATAVIAVVLAGVAAWYFRQVMHRRLRRPALF